MSKELPTKIDRTKLITQAAYARKIGVSSVRVNQKIKEGKIDTVKIEGAVLVYLR